MERIERLTRNIERLIANAPHMPLTEVAKALRAIDNEYVAVMANAPVVPSPRHLRLGEVYTQLLDSIYIAA